ncbi:MAG: cobalamin-dependent protein [bacterium]
MTKPKYLLPEDPRILLSSIFGPYAQDDSYGSRKCNPMELYQNQVTRMQGPFSLRMFHRSCGLMLIQANISAKCALLDFPDLERFIKEISENEYDIIGISGIYSNLLKVRKMCELIREYQPDAQIVIGGHIASVTDLDKMLDADHIVRGDGVRWFREFLGDDPDAPINHPVITSGIATRTLGLDVFRKPGDVAAMLIPSVGCPMGCSFCSTSAMFGGKGKCINFYETGDELFDILCQLEDELKVNDFFVMDENFLMNKNRALRLLELMEKNGKPWAFYIFASANILRLYSMDQLVRFGISWVWIGLESEDSNFAKLNGIDVKELVSDMQSHGIRVLGSSIIGMEHHTPKNMDRVIDYAVSYDADFHQFMLYTALPGTPDFIEFEKRGIMKDDIEGISSDSHGQHEFNYHHPHIKNGEENAFLLDAFTRDFETNGPSLARMVKTLLKGWQKYKNDPDPRVRKRFQWEVRNFRFLYSTVIGGIRLYYKDNPAMRSKMEKIQNMMQAEFGILSRLAAEIGGRFLVTKIRREEKELENGKVYGPPTFYERNFGAVENGVSICKSVASRVSSALDDVNLPHKKVLKKAAAKQG